ncbi:hypothetical protein HYU22_01210 [Candidatus Woesearchaeota archaeon]|nr:hypothetical protein [Candidatus Woesearchaeota archaeon]
MVIGNVIQGLIALAAALAALAGFVALEGFFRNKLKELFEDKDYFIFFFLVWGYLLYALGEVSYYLTKFVFDDQSLLGIQDVYWSGGAFLTVVSFLALALMLYRQHPHSGKLLPQLLVGGVLIVLVALYLFVLIQPATTFSYVYPLLSSLIVAFAVSVLLFSQELADFGASLKLFFVSSCFILLGDLFFAYTAGQVDYGAVAMIGDLGYLIGYTFSAIAFVVLRLRMHSLAFED